tara:strand:+ start:446 stop:565 length:120 start_codon:yes stop_codon:yes gene_type:complete
MKVYNAVSDNPINIGNLIILSMDFEYKVIRLITEMLAIK